MPIEETKSDPNGPCSVNKLLELYDEMIVPHFQRGLVWDKSSVSLLLESLYCKTPCGLIILWTPTNPQQEGVPLGENPRYLIVDGQQRIRCLWTVFKGGMDESIGYSKEVNESAGDMENEGTEEDGERNRVWCLNLGRVYELEKDFTGGKRFSLFRLANDPRKDTKDIPLATIRDREALLPLRWFLDHTDEEIAVLVEKSDDGALKKAVNAVLGNDVVKKTLRDMLSYNHFHVSTLNTMYKLEDVIGIYNRINSAGKRVESEEKAFANVVSVYPDVNKKLEEFYKSVHPLAHSKNLSDKLSRDNFLQRQKENRFGFKLFMRTLAQVLAYHFSKSIGASTFSFESINADIMNNERTREHLSNILDETKKFLVYLASVLRKELHCDNFRMLPETSSFWPIIQLIIRFPGLMDGEKGVTASLALRLLLADKQKKELLKLAAGVNESQNVKEALELFEKDSDLTRKDREDDK